MKTKTITLIFLISFISFVNMSAQNRAISDSLDVIHYNINLDLVHLSTHRISGNTKLTIVPKKNGITSIPLNLLKLTVDSVYYNGVKTSNFIYNDTIIRTNLSTSINTNDTVNLTVFYHGVPVYTSWGGFYFTADSSYAYNMGVGLNAQPHSFGKVWYPCIDEFTDKAYYDYYITVKNDKKAVCGGTLMSVNNNGNNTSTYHWKLHAEIPAYTSSVAVGNYVAVKDTFNGFTGKVPIQIYVPASDTNRAKASFINLKSILTVFESRFGPYLWERIGYVGVPFLNGAMEHATNIAYPLYAIDGGLTNQDLYAHELSHQWFGNLVTCTTEQDMWINEGWARYSESIYLEGLYGAVSYKNNIRDNHLTVLQTAHIADDGYRAVYGIPSEYTYGNTVYDKGGDMVHTLRNYMGDALFFSSIKAMLNAFKFKNISTIEMRDFLSNYSGINLNDFFTAWINNPGFPHFSVDSFKVRSMTPQIKVKVWVRQKLNNAPAFANSNRVELTFGKNNWQLFTDTIHFSGQYGSKEFVLPFVPEFVMMDYNEKTSDATTDIAKIIKTTGTYTLPAALCNLDVVSVSDSALVRIEHNWVAPDNLKVSNPIIKGLSDTHYWKVDGIFPSGFVSKGKFKYNRSISTTTENLDVKLLPYTSSLDSILLLYRKDAADDWRMINFIRSGVAAAGYLVVDTLKRGEYTFAVGKPYFYNIDKHEKTRGHFDAYPNPSNDTFTFTFTLDEQAEIKIFNDLGKEIDKLYVYPAQKSILWFPKHLDTGVYIAKLLNSDKGIINEKKLLLIK